MVWKWVQFSKHELACDFTIVCAFSTKKCVTFEGLSNDMSGNKKNSILLVAQSNMPRGISRRLSCLWQTKSKQRDLNVAHGFIGSNVRRPVDRRRSWRCKGKCHTAEDNMWHILCVLCTLIRLLCLVSVEGWLWHGDTRNLRTAAVRMICFKRIVSPRHKHTKTAPRWKLLCYHRNNVTYHFKV